MALGGYVSFSGILTFKNSDELRAIAAGVPHDRLLVETDAPYLAPVPFRGKRNEPAYVTNTARVLAETIGVTGDEIATITTDNFFRLFKKMPRQSEAGLLDRGRCAALHDSRLRLIAGHAAHHRRLGQLRSRQPEKPAHALRRDGRTYPPGRRARRASSSTPVRTFASRC